MTRPSTPRVTVAVAVAVRNHLWRRRISRPQCVSVGPCSAQGVHCAWSATTPVQGLRHPRRTTAECNEPGKSLVNFGLDTRYAVLVPDNQA
ncbi:hypothetical protein FMEAI12_3890053 [Parafrankia sp. Ea1.12]|nr:hypothetical protein FMEAI12_3890053 [Parafrankia sp. Ea1.12]